MRKILIYSIIGIVVLVLVSCFVLLQPTPQQKSVHQKAEKVQEGIVKWIQAGRDPSPVAEIIKEIGPLLKENKFRDAELVLDRALALLGTEKVDQPENNISTISLGDEPYITEPRQVKVGNIPDNAEIVYHQKGFIYVMDKDAEKVTQITFENPRKYEHVAVSYDRKYLIANDHEPKDSGVKPSRLWIFNLQEGTEAQLVPRFSMAGDGGISFDPSGNIYFPGSFDPNLENKGARDVYKIYHNGTNLVRLTATPGIQEADPGVSEDGSLVAYLSVPQGKNYDELWVMNSDGTNPRAIIEKAGPLGVASVHDPEISSDNKKVVFSKWNSEQRSSLPGTGGYKHDLWSINIDGTELQRLTKPGTFAIIPNVKNDMVLFTEIRENGGYVSSVSTEGIEQAPRRIKAGANAPKWIPLK